MVLASFYTWLWLALLSASYVLTALAVAIKQLKAYSSNLTQWQWELIEPLIPPAKHGGRSREVEVWSVLNAIFYLLTQGCTWRNLPGDFPAWQTVYTYFVWRVTRHAQNWRKDGTWVAIHERLRDWVRSGALRSGSQTMKVRQDS